LDAARALAEQVVVDCGFNLEDDEELSYDTAAPRRNAATLSTLTAADEILVIGTAEPVGLTRLVAGLDDLRTVLEAAGSAPTVRVVVNRMRTSARQRREVIAALERHAGISPTALLPLDPDAADRAQREGRLLLEVEPRSPLRLAIAGLVAAPGQVGPRDARLRGRGWRVSARAG
jgi:Flp pilus assembly CpaE family ATPase